MIKSIARPLALIIVLPLTACLGTLDSKPGSYRKLPEGVSISKDGTLLAQATVVRIADADSLTVMAQDGQQYRIRLQGIDAPERKQAYGTLCREKLSRLAQQKTVQVEAYKKDRYGRVVAKVRLNNNDLALMMLEQGCAWHYKAYAAEQGWRDKRAYDKAERTARQKQLGLWRNRNPLPPWKFRRQNRGS